MNKYILVSPLIILLLLIVGSANAQTMRNDYYKIQMGNFNTAGGTSSGGGKKVGITVGQTFPGLYSGTNYTVRAGFQYIHSIIPFAFSISSTTIDFGTVVPGEPISRDNTLTISNGSAHGYQVTALEDHPMRISSLNIDIPDTTCDSGTCTETTSATWSSILTYGFGYRCDNISGTDCATGFTTSSLFKQFANQSNNEDSVAVMIGTNVGRNKQAKITYKLNVAPTQRAGYYQNSITYIATPTF